MRAKTFQSTWRRSSPGEVGAVLGEFLAEAEVGRAVQAGNETVDHGLGDEVETGEAGEGRRIKEALQHRKLHRKDAEAQRGRETGSPYASTPV